MRGSIVGFVVPLGTRLSVDSATTFLSRTVAVSTTATGATTPTALAALLPSAGADKLTDFTGAAIQFFNSERVTAALIAGASLSSLFSLAKLAKEVGVTPKVKDDYHQTLTWVLTRLYHGLCLMSVLLSLNVVVISTLACSTLLLEKHNGMAYNAYEFLFRELRYEFITTQWSFLMGLLSFIVSIATRSLLEFDLIRKGRRRSGLFVVFSVSALLAHLVSYINSTLHHWPNLAGMLLIMLESRSLIDRGCMNVVCDSRTFERGEYVSDTIWPPSQQLFCTCEGHYSLDLASHLIVHQIIPTQSCRWIYFGQLFTRP